MIFMPPISFGSGFKIPFREAKALPGRHGGPVKAGLTAHDSGVCFYDVVDRHPADRDNSFSCALTALENYGGFYPGRRYACPGLFSRRTYGAWCVPLRELVDREMYVFL